jgi:hypothetical protein
MITMGSHGLMWQGSNDAVVFDQKIPKFFVSCMYASRQIVWM